MLSAVKPVLFPRVVDHSWAWGRIQKMMKLISSPPTAAPVMLPIPPRTTVLSAVTETANWKSSGETIPSSAP